MKRIFLTIICLIANLAIAAEPITFDQAQEIAWQNSRQLGVAKVDTEKKAIALDNISLRYKPKFRSNVGAEGLADRNEFKASTIANVTGSYLLYDGSQQVAEERVAGLEVELSKIDQDSLKVKLYGALKAIFIEYDFRKKAIGELEQQILEIKKFAKMARRRQELGTSTGTDSLNFAVDQSVVEAKIEENQAGLQALLEEFNFLLGSESEYLPEQSPEDLFQGKSEERSAILSPSLRAIEISNQVTEAKLDALERSASVKISLDGYAGVLPLSERVLEKPLSAGIALVATYDITENVILNARKREILIENSMNTASKTAIEYERTRKRIHLENESKRIVTIVDRKMKAMDLAKKHYKKASSEYSSGIVSLFEIKDSWERMMQLVTEIRELDRERYQTMLQMELALLQ